MPSTFVGFKRFLLSAISITILIVIPMPCLPFLLLIISPQYHCYSTKTADLSSWSQSVSIITFSSHRRVVKHWLHADSLKVALIPQIKAAIGDWRPVTDVCGTGWVKAPSLCGRSGWQQQHVAPEWLRWISSCMCFVGVSWTVVDLQIDFNSWNEKSSTQRLWGCAVDSWAVNKWSVVAGASRRTSSLHSINWRQLQSRFDLLEYCTSHGEKCN